MNQKSTSFGVIKNTTNSSSKRQSATASIYRNCFSLDFLSTTDRSAYRVYTKSIILSVKTIEYFHCLANCSSTLYQFTLAETVLLPDFNESPMFIRCLAIGAIIIQVSNINRPPCSADIAFRHPAWLQRLRRRVNCISDDELHHFGEDKFCNI